MIKLVNGKHALIDIKVIKRERKNKILTTIIIFMVIVVWPLASAISLNEKTKAMAIARKQQEQVVEEVPVVVEQPKKYPVFSEAAMNKIQKIYEPREGGEKIAYLTFDDGPSQEITPQILDILKNEDVKATFFVLGSRVELHPELLKREYEEGHYIANHGYSHIYKNVYSSPQAVFDEYNSCENRIKSVLGNEYSSHLFRFPGGTEGGGIYKKTKQKAIEILQANNVCYINWNSLNNDAVGKPTRESLIADIKRTTNRKTNSSCFNARYRNKTTYSRHTYRSYTLSKRTRIHVQEFLRYNVLRHKNKEEKIWD